MASHHSHPDAVFLIVSDTLELVLSIWSFVLFLKCLGEVHRFSAWRALGAAILGGLVILAVMLPLILLIVAGAMGGG